MQTSLKFQHASAIIQLWGRFDLGARQEFLHIFQRAKTETTKEIIIDLREVSFADSTAIGLLMLAHRKCQDSSIALRLCATEGGVKQTLDLLNIPDIIPTSSSL